MIDQAELNAKEEADWRERFDKQGREAVRERLRRNGYPRERERNAAERWLREKELEAEGRERKLFGYVKWTWDAALAAAILAAIGIVIALYNL